MSLSVSAVEPASIRAGDSASWRLSLPDYPAGSGWGITYTFVKAGAKITLASAADGDAHLISPAPATTAGWAPGNYQWQARVSDGADAYTIRTGSIDILPDFASLSPGGMDSRSHAQKTLAAIEAWIESRDLGVAEYNIDGKQLKTISIADLLLLRDRYRREVRATSGRSGRIYLRL